MVGGANGKVAVIGLITLVVSVDRFRLIRSKTKNSWINFLFLFRTQ